MFLCGFFSFPKHYHKIFPLKTYSKNTFKKHCDAVRSKHKEIEKLHLQYGYPPYWKREKLF
jgi:hypothetical protein